MAQSVIKSLWQQHLTIIAGNVDARTELVSVMREAASPASATPGRARFWKPDSVFEGHDDVTALLCNELLGDNLAIALVGGDLSPLMWVTFDKLTDDAKEEQTFFINGNESDEDDYCTLFDIVSREAMLTGITAKRTKLLERYAHFVESVHGVLARATL